MSLHKTKHEASDHSAWPLLKNVFIYNWNSELLCFCFLTWAFGIIKSKLDCSSKCTCCILLVFMLKFIFPVRKSERPLRLVGRGRGGERGPFVEDFDPGQQLRRSRPRKLQEPFRRISFPQKPLHATARHQLWSHTQTRLVKSTFTYTDRHLLNC